MGPWAGQFVRRKTIGQDSRSHLGDSSNPVESRKGAPIVGVLETAEDIKNQAAI